MDTLSHEEKKINLDISSHTDFIDEQIQFHKSRAEQFKDDSNPYRHAKHTEVAAYFKELKNLIIALNQEVIELRNNASSKTISGRPFLSLTQEDLNGLPEEQIEELSISSADKAEFAIISMLEKHGGIMSLDQIIVGLYRETEELQKRTTVTARLYRMANKEMIYTVPLKKGVYSLNEITEEEAEKMFRGGS